MPCMPSAAVLLLVVLAFASPTPNRAKVPHTWQEHGQLTDLDVLRNSPAVDDDLLRRVRETKPSFEVGFNKMFQGMTLHDAQQLMGVIKNPKAPNLPTRINKPVDLPTDFDSREKWGDACPSVKEIRDQGSTLCPHVYPSNCGSCWAFGSVEALTDRICIASNGTTKAHLSAQDLTSCDIIENQGCNGGIPELAWSYMKTNGVVTGGNFGDHSMCYSYQLAPCAHHINGTKYGPCPDSNKTPLCARKCVDNGDKWESDKHHATSVYSVCQQNGETTSACSEAMAQEIYQNGPITAMFFVHQSFLAYKSGVYSRKLLNDPMLGGHAIKIIGFGVEDGTDYWLVANSWNEAWGMDGFFKIKRGVNECQIEDAVIDGGPVAGEPKL